MAGRALHLVTIVCGVSVEPRLMRDLKDLGVVGYTRSATRGEGRLSLPDEWEGQNARIEALVTPEVATSVMAHLEESYITRYPMVAWVATVEAFLSGDQVEVP